MKAGSDNRRSSAIFDVMDDLHRAGIKIIVYDKDIPTSENVGYEKLVDLTQFISRSDIVIANRVDLEIRAAGNKLYTRDIFHVD